MLNMQVFVAGCRRTGTHRAVGAWAVAATAPAASPLAAGREALLGQSLARAPVLPLLAWARARAEARPEQEWAQVPPEQEWAQARPEQEWAQVQPEQEWAQVQGQVQGVLQQHSIVTECNSPDICYWHSIAPVYRTAA